MVKFVYFDAEAKGEVARLLLAAGNIDYEDFRISFADWPKHKADTPFGQIPLLYWDGEELAQSWAISKYIARKVGWVGKTNLEFAQADMVACHTEDLWYEKWKVRSGCLKKIAPGNSRGQIFQTTTEDFWLFFRLCDKKQ